MLGMDDKGAAFVLDAIAEGQNNLCGQTKMAQRVLFKYIP